MLRRLLLGSLFLMIATSNLFAQIIPPNTGESTKPSVRVGSDYTILPIVGYSSDIGFVGGGLLQRINYGNDIRPFLSDISVFATISTKGSLGVDVRYERTKTFGTGIRSRIDFVASRILKGYYFGIGNQTAFSNNQFDKGYFFFENREFSIYYQARQSLFSFGSFGKFDLTASADFSYLNGFSKESSRFSDDNPFGAGKSWSNKTGAGFIADSRDNEFSPSRGIRYEFSYEVSAPLLGSDYTYSDIEVDLRHYLKLFNNVVVANNLNINSIQGDAPFWDLAMIGGDDELRGFHLERFRGNQSVFHLLELRTWLFSFWNDGIRVGGQAFWDTGRVFSENDSNDVFQNWHHAYGGGVIFSAFNPDLLFRMDVGFSDEAYRIYFGTGYVF